MLKTYPRFTGILMIVLAFALDQITKTMILTDIMNPPTILSVTSFFNLVLAWNTGVSFSLFDSYGVTGTNILIGVSGLVTLMFVIWLMRTRTVWMTTSLGLIIGGALGNLYDRVVYGAVVDFLDFHAGGYHWPAFNLADTFITIGVSFILIDSFFDPKGDHNA